MKIIYVPHFELTLNKELVRSFKRMSELHYDAVCKAASHKYEPGKQQGFIAGWLNATMHFANKQGEYNVVIDSNKLDILLKICENTSCLPELRKPFIYRFVAHCHHAIKLAYLSTPDSVNVP